MSAPLRWRIHRRVAIGSAAVAIVWAALAVPAKTKQGVDFHVSVSTVPLYVKAIDFLHRHYQYVAAARSITQDVRSDRDRARAVFAWTRAHIRPTPKGWPIVDDHISHIMIRGYGTPDQMADVFTTLCTYSGVPAFWRVAKLGGDERAEILSFARIDGRWAAFDVAEGYVLTLPGGGLADARALLADPARLRAIAAAATSSGVPYWRYLEATQPFRIPALLRAEAQMPLARLAYEVKRALHLAGEPDARSERPAAVAQPSLRTAASGAMP